MSTLAALLSENGLPDLPVSLIEPHRDHGGLWRIKFNYETGEPLSMSATQASAMALRLLEMGEVELADEIDEITKAFHRYLHRLAVRIGEPFRIAEHAFHLVEGRSFGGGAFAGEPAPARAAAPFIRAGIGEHEHALEGVRFKARHGLEI